MRSVLFLTLHLLTGAASAADPGLFAWLPPGPQAAAGIRLDVAHDFSPSGSTWNGGLDERQVFHAALTVPGAFWRIGVGKGGQIFSLRGPFGEAIPPQRPPLSEWNDEVWQPVAVSQTYQRDARETGWPFFLHGSGTYRRDPDQEQTLYGPLVASRHDPEQASYSVITWPQQANLPTPFRSGVFFLTRFRPLDVHTLEVTYVIHNVGQEVIDFMNLPWGGVRASAFPVRQIAMPDGTWREQAGLFATPREGLPVTETGGFLLFAAGEAGTDAALALTLGRGTPPWPGGRLVWRGGTAGDLVHPRSRQRDYAVSSCILQHGEGLAHGQTLVHRTFFVIGPRAEVEAQARKLVAEVETRRFVWDPADAPKLENGRWAVPVPGSRPVFEIHRAGREPEITHDPYADLPAVPAANPLPPDHPRHALHEGRTLIHPVPPGPGTEWRLLGFERPEAENDE